MNRTLHQNPSANSQKRAWLMMIVLIMSFMAKGVNSQVPPLTLTDFQISKPASPYTDLLIENDYSKVFKAPATSPFDYFLVSRTSTSDISDRIGFITLDSSTKAITSDYMKKEEKMVNCDSASTIKQSKILMVCVGRSNDIYLYDMATEATLTQTYSFSGADMVGENFIMQVFLKEDLTSFVTFGDNTPGIKFSIPGNLNQGSLGGALVTLKGDPFTSLDAVYDSTADLAYCVTDDGKVRVIDTTIEQSSGDSQRPPYDLDSGANLSAIERSAGPDQEIFAVGQMTGTNWISLLRIPAPSSSSITTLHSIPFSPDTIVVISGIVADKGGRGFFVITTATTDYVTKFRNKIIADKDSIDDYSRLWFLTLESRNQVVEITKDIDNLHVIFGIYSVSATEIILLTKTKEIRIRELALTIPECQEACGTCSGAGKYQCLSCETGYIEGDDWESGETEGLCILDPVCPRGCAVCSGEGKYQCSECKEGHIKDSNWKSDEIEGQCIVKPFCFQGCGTCSGFGKYQCTSCAEGYSKRGAWKEGETEGPCFNNYRCHKSCRGCVGPEKYYCTSCAPDYQKGESWKEDDTSGVCIKPDGLDCNNKYIPNCAECKIFLRECKICQPGYGMKNYGEDKRQGCFPCFDHNCLECMFTKDLQICKTCKDNFKVNRRSKFCDYILKKM